MFLRLVSMVKALVFALVAASVVVVGTYEERASEDEEARGTKTHGILHVLSRSLARSERQTRSSGLPRSLTRSLAHSCSLCASDDHGRRR